MWNALFTFYRIGMRQYPDSLFTPASSCQNCRFIRAKTGKTRRSLYILTLHDPVFSLCTFTLRYTVCHALSARFFKPKAQHSEKTYSRRICGFYVTKTLFLHPHPAAFIIRETLVHLCIAHKDCNINTAMRRQSYLFSSILKLLSLGVDCIFFHNSIDLRKIL